MHTLHATLLTAHIIVGTIAVFAFWLPVIARKGGPLHVRAGRIYAWTMYAVSATAIVMSLAVLFDPVGIRFPDRDLQMQTAFAVANGNRMFATFLLMLGLLVLSALRHGLLALRVRRGEVDALRATSHRLLIVTLGVMGVIVSVIGFRNWELLLMIFGVLSISGSISMLRETLRPKLTPREALIAHFDGLIGTGIGAYTALFAFGGREFLSTLLSGQWQVVPWVTPAIIGMLAGAWLKRQYSETRAKREYTERSTA